MPLVLLYSISSAVYGMALLGSFHFPMSLLVTLSMAAVHSGIYRVAHKCQFLCADFFQVAPGLKVGVAGSGRGSWAWKGVGT